MSPKSPGPADPLPQAQPTPLPPEDESPPFLGSWTALYLLVIAELLGVILLCYWITLHNV